eukprot:COSAG01_NODE_10272_length_2204_cov_1.907363_1_plen_578_part_10
MMPLLSTSLVGLLIVVVCSPMIGSTCSMNNAYDAAVGPSAAGCAVIANRPVYAGGAGDCEFELGKGGRYAGYCNLYCNHNKYDVTPNLQGSNGQIFPSCAALLAAGYSCTAHFGSGQQLGVGGVIQQGMAPNTHGFCDFECGFCPRTYTPRQDDCWVSDKYDHTNGLGSCAALLAAGTYSCSAHFHSGRSFAGHCNLACELNLLEHPAAYVAAGVTQAQIDYIAGVLAPGIGLNVTAFKAIMRPGTSSAQGLCQVLIEAYANAGVDACNLYFAQRRLLFGVAHGMCDFACGFCQATDGLQYVANTTVFAVTTPDCLTPGDCCSVANASNYTGDAASCAVSLAAGIQCGHLFAPDRAFSGQCDLACRYCLPAADPCANITCGAHGNCTSVHGIGSCTCDPDWLGGQCQFTTAQCTANSLGSGSGSWSGSWSGSSSWGIIRVTMTMPGNVAVLTCNGVYCSNGCYNCNLAEVAFEVAFEQDIATVLGIDATRINVTSIAATSIVVTYTIAPDANGNQLSPAAVRTTLADPITFSTIQNSQGLGYRLGAAYASPVTATGITATGVPAPEPEPEPPSGTITL